MAFNASLFQGFPDIYQTIEDVVTEGDKVVYGQQYAVLTLEFVNSSYRKAMQTSFSNPNR